MNTPEIVEKEKRTIDKTNETTETDKAEKKSRISNIFEPNPDINYTNKNTIIFSSVRMNPPTPGHLHLIDTLIGVAKSINITQVYLILSKTQNCDNPLTCEEKKYWLSQIIQSKSYDVGVDIICVEDKPGQLRKPTPFTPISNLVGQYIRNGGTNLNLIMVLGSDRIDLLESITDQYYYKNSNVNSIDGVILHRDENMEYFKNLPPGELFKMLSETEEDVPIESISASLIRKIVANGAKDIFNKIYKKYLNPTDIDSFYENIKNSLIACKNIKGSKQSTATLKNYDYPMIKVKSVPISEKAETTTIGGKSVKRKTIKRKTTKRKTTKRKTTKRKIIKTKKYNKRLK
jgi:hypothetical protein